eukprot:652957-Rhodomonas_salina.1
MVRLHDRKHKERARQQGVLALAVRAHASVQHLPWAHAPFPRPPSLPDEDQQTAGAQVVQAEEEVREEEVE